MLSALITSSLTTSIPLNITNSTPPDRSYRESYNLQSTGPLETVLPRDIADTPYSTPSNHLRRDYFVPYFLLTRPHVSYWNASYGYFRGWDFNIRQSRAIAAHFRGISDQLCQYSDALFFETERNSRGVFTKCRADGKISLPEIPYLHLQNLFENFFYVNTLNLATS